MLPDVRIAAQRNDHRRPGRRRIHKPMNDEHDGLIRVVGLEARDSRGLRKMLRPQEARELLRHRICADEHRSNRDGEIGGERKAFPTETDPFGCKRVFKAEHRMPPLKSDDGGDPVERARQAEILPCVLIHFPSDGDERGAKPLLARAFGDVLSFHVKLVGRREGVKRRVPLRARIRLDRKHIAARRRRHAQRM